MTEQRKKDFNGFPALRISSIILYIEKQLSAAVNAQLYFQGT